jgi:hypothetical protein
MVYFYLLFPLIFEIGLSIWVYKDAENHGSDYSFIWAAGTIILGPILLGVWLFVRNMDFDEPFVSCPSCREYYSGDPFVCPRCGYALKCGIVDMSALYPVFDDPIQDEKRKIDK